VPELEDGFDERYTHQQAGHDRQLPKQHAMRPEIQIIQVVDSGLMTSPTTAPMDWPAVRQANPTTKRLL